MEKRIFKRVLIVTFLVSTLTSVTFVSAESQSTSVTDSLAQIAEQAGAEAISDHADNSGNGQYQLGSGDRVKVTVYGHTDLSGEFQLDGSGRISLPLIKDIQASGLTALDLETAIAEKLSPDYLKDPKVSAEVLNYRPFYIIGEVKNPGQYAYVNGMSVLTAVALAGGYTYRAKNDKALITRQHGDASDKGLNVGNGKVNAQQNTHIQPGDVIEIPEKYWLF